MKRHKLVGEDVELVLKENVLAVLSSKTLSIMSSAIHNGGCKKTNTIINTQVTDDYGDRRLHDDPELFIIESSKKLGSFDDFVGMVTYASVKDFSLVSKIDGDLAVSVIATAGCTHAESSGEEIETREILGTINIIVIIDGNPTKSCLASTLITATEAKTAALRDLDLRSRYSGDEATGTITDALVAAKTGRGLSIVYGGPASKLGKLIGFCTRKAVKDATTTAKVGGFSPSRSIIKRLTERHLSMERLAVETSKIKGISIDHQQLEKLLKSKPIFATFLLAAAKLDDDIKKGLMPKEFGNVNLLSSQFSELFVASNITKVAKIINQIDEVNLPPFTKHVLIRFLMNNNSNEKNENLK
ncbi:adenosylcobinamide amidohydrolase [Candidatus Bathyarchaeota archaeon]|nr:adenosylcobinamide amidohydrolase [Candidatus Bathyarchaeota archaeon]